MIQHDSRWEPVRYEKSDEHVWWISLDKGFFIEHPMREYWRNRRKSDAIETLAACGRAMFKAREL